MGESMQYGKVMIDGREGRGVVRANAIPAISTLAATGVGFVSGTWEAHIELCRWRQDIAVVVPLIDVHTLETAPWLPIWKANDG